MPLSHGSSGKRCGFGDNREVCKAFVCQYAPLRSCGSWGPAEAKRCTPAPRRLHWMANVMVMWSTLSSHSTDATFRRPNAYRVGLLAQANFSGPTFESAHEARAGKRAALSVYLSQLQLRCSNSITDPQASSSRSEFSGK